MELFSNGHILIMMATKADVSKKMIGTQVVHIHERAVVEKDFGTKAQMLKFDISGKIVVALSVDKLMPVITEAVPHVATYSTM